MTTQSLAVNPLSEVLTVPVLNLGSVNIQRHGSEVIKVTATSSGLKIDNLLYSFSGTMAKQGETWVFQADRISLKLPAKVKARVLAVVSDAVNDFMAEQSEDITDRIKAYEWLQRQQGLEFNVQQAIERVEYATQQVARVQEALLTRQTELVEHRQALAQHLADAHRPEGVVIEGDSAD